jgi:hypothetical protein
MRPDEERLFVISDHRDESIEPVMSSYMNFFGLTSELININMDN